MDKKSEKETMPEINLTVKKSPVRFGGSARVHDSVLKKLNCEEKEQIVLINDEKKILQTIFADETVTEGAVMLRSEAMKKLGVEEGDKITLQRNKEIFANLKNKAEKLKDSVKEKLSKKPGRR